MWVNEVLRMFIRWPSFGGCSSSMDWVRPTAIWAIAESVSATGPPSPMFSPAAVQCTPAAVSRSPIAASPGHWCESPQPSAIFRLCADELACRPEVTVSGARPAPERAWLISASTCAAAVPPWAAVGAPARAEGAADVAVLPPPDPVAGATGCEEADGAGDRADRAVVWCARAAWRGGTVTTAGATATAISSGLAPQAAMSVAPQPAVAAWGPAAACPDAGLDENTSRAR